jgi:hypothetical protein
MASWKIFEKPADQEVIFTPFNNARKFLAIDASGSTGGAPMLAEQNFAIELHNSSTHNEKDWMAKWGSTADNPTNEWSPPAKYWRSDMMGTQPTTILKHEACLLCIYSSDIFFLLTDGEVCSDLEFSYGFR